MPAPAYTCSCIPSAIAVSYIWTKDRVLLTTDAEGMKVYKIITRQTRRPEVGHSAATRCPLPHG